MSHDVLFILSFSVLLAAILSLARFPKIRKTFYPFIYLIWVASANEVISFILIKNGYYNIINSNIYCLTESLLLLWFFRNIDSFKEYRSAPAFLAGLFILTWIFENFILSPFGTAFTSRFNLVYSFPVVLLSINAINGLLIKEKELAKNPVFLICVGLIIFFTYRIVVEVFWIFDLNTSAVFENRVYDILSIINLLCNLIYTFAILWMQKKQAFTLRF